MRKRAGMRRARGIRPRTGRLRALLALGAVLVAGTGGTWALWTDSATVSGLTFTTGTLDIKVNALDNVTNYTGLNATGMYPGATSAGTLTVSNAGSTRFSYTITSAVASGSATLATALTVAVYTGATVSGTGLTATCTGGTALTTTGSLNGTVLGTAQTLAIGGSQTLCLQVTLPTSAANALQSLSVGATLTFSATQA
jgi:predicted ribosomally synthesized peptide with SipW-like signal peptide